MVRVDQQKLDEIPLEDLVIGHEAYLMGLFDHLGEIKFMVAIHI
jgi:hypothetical protein